MPRYVKIILWGCVAVVASLVLCVALALTIGADYAKPWINRQASAIAGRPVAVQGDLTLSWVKPQNQNGWHNWIPWPQIHAEQLVVGNPPSDQTGANMAEVKSLTVELNPWALFNHTVEISNLDIHGANLVLERQVDQQNNWTFTPDGATKATPSPWTVDLQKLSLEQVALQVKDAVSRLDLKATIDSLPEVTPEGYGIEWTANGTYNGAKVSGKGQAGKILSLQQNSAPFPLQGAMTVGTTTISLDGSLTKPQALAALDVRLKLAGNTMSALYPLTGVVLPNTPPYHTEGHLVGTLEAGHSKWLYENFKGVVGKSDLEGTLQYQVQKPRSLLTGTVESKLLRLKDLGPLIGADTSDAKAKGAQAPKVKQPADKVLPVDPISTAAWGAMDADVKFTGQKIIRNKDLPLDNLSTHLVLTDRVLSLTPLNFGMAGGTLSNTIKLDGRGSQIKANLTTSARHLKLKRLFPAAQTMDASFGELHGDASLSAEGTSVATLLAHSNGEIKALVSKGTISKLLLETAGLNVANIIMVRLFGDKQIVLNCLAGDFTVSKGLMQVREFTLDTQDAIVNITGQINLATEQLDLNINPENKTLRIFTLRSPLYVKGTFKHPDVGVQKGPIIVRAGAAIVLGVIATPFAALLPLLNTGENGSNDCASLLARANKVPKAPPAGETRKTESRDRPAASKAPAKPTSAQPKPEH
ncbi:MAG: AsmA family protein [Candidimonas sp.]|nr:MAG: AsmA family protein [Candidimonas sp.]TAM22407.1 MAG: AsmA family protein [Candidimonas sp.]TAM77116.1 MAG: AsmA family protein [Candidimonas sp.]